MSQNNNCVTLRQYLDNAGSIWAAINSLEPFPFITDEVQLEYMQTLNYGERIMAKAFIGVTVDDAAAQIILLYKDKWDKVMDFQNFAGNIGVTSGRKIGGNVTTNTHKLGDGETINSVAAYNSINMVKDNATDFNNQETITEEVIKDTTDETFSVKAAFENLPLVERTNIINIVLKDVASYLTLSVY